MASTNKFSIVPATPEDLPAIASLVHTSKQTLTINRVLFKDWPNEAAQRPIYAAAVEAGFRDPQTQTLKAVDDTTGEILGHLVFATRRAATESKGPIKDESGKAGDDGVPECFNPGVLRMVGEAVTELRKDWEGVDHCELIHIYVALTHRNRGIGSQFMKLCIDNAKAEGLPLAFESEPAVRGFFLKHGFKDTKHADMDLRPFSPEYCGFGMFRLWGMVMRDL